MTRSILIAAAISCTVLVTSCGDNAPKGDDATITDAKQKSAAEGMQFMIDTAASYIRFTGNGVGKNHPGKFRLSSGTVAAADGRITGGDFVINISSMDLEEKGGMFDEKLRPHLMSGDFFDAEKFGTATFAITGVQPYTRSASDTSIIEGANFNVSGNLTLKNVTKNVTFPAHVELDDNTLKAKANFDINRTDWQMNYGNDKTLGNKFISEVVNIQLDLQANKR